MFSTAINMQGKSFLSPVSDSVLKVVGPSRPDEGEGLGISEVEERTRRGGWIVSVGRNGGRGKGFSTE